MRLTTISHLRIRRGFSILEMLIVVILVGIVMSIAGVKMTTIMTQQRVVRAASTIQTDMELAYAVASRNRKPMRIIFSSSASAILVRVTNRAGDTTYRQTNLKEIGLSHGQVTSSSPEITVFPNGFASDTLSILISVTQNGVTHKRRVRMSRAGLVKVI
jgi:prepilin-type N-terminal cleavage/methylation domain-containing protein